MNSKKKVKKDKQKEDKYNISIIFLKFCDYNKTITSKNIKLNNEAGKILLACRD